MVSEARVCRGGEKETIFCLNGPQASKDAAFPGLFFASSLPVRGTEYVIGNSGAKAPSVLGPRRKTRTALSG